MKVLVVFTAMLLVSGTQAGFLDSLKTTFSGIGDVFKATGQSLVSQLDTVATQLLNAATHKGLDLLSQTTQALAMNTASQFTGQKRDLSAFLGKVDSVKNEVVDMLRQGEGQLKGVLGNVIKAFDGVLSKVASFEISPETVRTTIDAIVGAHSSLMNKFMKDLVRSVETIVGKHFNLVKRSAVGDFFSSLGSSLASTFSPMVEGVKNLVSTTGDSLKATATSLLQSAKDSVSQLGTKLTPHLQTLQGHAQTLLQHGTNALSALKDATADVFQQTMNNMQDPLNKIKQTLVNAGQTAVQHVAGQLLANAAENALTNALTPKSQ